MRYVDRQDLHASVLGFGCGAVLGRSGRGDSLRALATAWDAGITLFDTARSYGYGEAEGLLGGFLRGKRDRAIVSTKFGIFPVPQSSWKQLAKPLIRGLLKVAPNTRSLVHKVTDTQFYTDRFTPADLRSSLEESLRQLRTDYVDILFLHSPPASVLERDDLLAALDEVVAQGKVRFAGLSADTPVVAESLRRDVPGLQAFQSPVNLFDLAATVHTPLAASPFLLANHPFGGLVRVAESQSRIQELARDHSIPSPIREKLTGDPRLLLADVVFTLILQGTGINAVISTMMRPENLHINVRALTESRFTPAEASTLRRHFLNRVP